MATNIRLKSSSVTGKTPTLSDLSLRELAVNTVDGKLFLRKGDGSGIDTIVDLTNHSTFSNLANDDHTQYIHATTTRIGVTAEFNTTGKITTTNRIGIGTTNPATSLHVITNTVQFGYLVRGQNIGTGSLENLLQTDKGICTWGLNSTLGGAMLETAGAGDLVFNLRTGGNVVFSADIQYQEQHLVITEPGNVGIGTTNPAYKLDVLGDINFTGTFYQNGTQFVASRWTAGTGDNIYRLNGNVGLGTTNPAEKIDVVGNIKLTGELRGPASFVIDPAAVGDNTGTVVIKGDLQVDGTTTTINSTTLTVDDKNITIADGVSTLANLDTAGIDFGSTAVRLRYNYNGGTNSGLSIEGTNVGIGTTNPTSKLHTVGTGLFENVGRFSGVNTDEYGEVPLIAKVNNSTFGNTFFGAINPYNYPTFAINVNGYSNSSTNRGSVEFYDKTDGNWNRSIVLNRGRVGIGTTNPGSILAVNGYITESTDNGVTYHNVVTQQDIGFNANQIPLNQYLGQLAFMDAYSPSGLRRDGGGADDVVVNSSGFIGIGTTNPEKLLHVRGGSDNGIIVDSTTGFPAIWWAENGTRKWSATTNLNSDGAFVIRESSVADRLTILTGGNVGIGITNPTSKLHVSGGDLYVNSLDGTDVDIKLGVHASDANFSVIRSTRVSDLQSLLSFNISSGGLKEVLKLDIFEGLYLKGVDDGTTAGNAGLITFSDQSEAPLAQIVSYKPGVDNAADLIFVTKALGPNFGERLRITAVGNVGIGTDNPQAKLDVSGDLKTTGKITVDFGTVLGDAYTGLEIKGDVANSTNLSFGVAQNISRTGRAGSFAGAYIDAEGSRPISFGTNGTERLSIEGNGNLIISNSVGIGTTNPTTKLDVVGIGQFTANGATLNLVGSDHTYIQLYPDGIAAGRKGYIGYPAAPINDLRIVNQISGANIELLPTSGNVLVNSSTATGTASQPFQVTGGAYVSGNVGIGAINPNRQLHIAASGESNIVLENYSAGTDQKKSRIYHDSSNDFRISFINDAFSNENYILWAKRGTGFTTAQTLLNPTSGNVGIGTTNALQKLHVAGGAILATNVGGASFLEIGEGQTSNQFAYVDLVGDTTYTDYGLRIIRGNTGSNTTSSITHRGLGELQIIANETGTIGFYIGGSADANNRVKISSTGNIGIGSTSPAVKLDIGGETSQYPYSLRIRNTAHATSKRAAIAFGNGAAYQILIDTNGNGTEDFSIYQANVNRSPFRIDATTGNICIGKGSAIAPTEFGVNGYISESTDGGVTYHNVVTQQDIGFNANQIPLNQYLGQLAFMDEYSPTEIYNPSNTTAQLTIAQTQTSGYAFIQLGKSATATNNFHLGSEGNGYLNFWNGNWGSGAGPRFTISSNGLVGINTSAPGAELVVGPGSTNVTSFPNEGAEVHLLPGANGTKRFCYDVFVNSFRFFTQDHPTGANYFEIYRITDTGRVGIGTTTPSGQLTVNTGPQWSAFNYSPNILIQGTRNNGLGILDAAGSNPWWIGNGGGNLYFAQMPALGNTATAPTLPFTITSTGNVGIGITNPGAKLDVSGDALINSIKAGRGGGNQLTNTAFGYQTLDSNFSGSNNVAVGYRALYVNSSGLYNVAIGATALNSNISGEANVAIGQQALYTNTTGIQNTAVGFTSLYGGNGTQNTALGFQTLFSNNNGGTNLALGAGALYSNSTGNSNAMLGAYAGYSNTSGSYNVYCGSWVGTTTTVSRRILIGTGTDFSNRFEGPNTASNVQLAIGHNISGITNYWIVGDSNYNVGIGTASPSYKLHVVGSFAATTKSFVIDHPTKPGFKLRYGSLEGPENGVYIRGKLSNNNTIELPEYWTELVHEDSITVNLTPIGRNPGVHSVIDISDNTIVIESTNDIINCFFTVFAERKDVDKLITEYES